MSLAAGTPPTPGAAANGSPAPIGSGDVVLELDAVTKIYAAEPPSSRCAASASAFAAAS